MIEKNTSQTIKSLPIEQLVVGGYQRQTNTRQVNAIAENFDEAKLGMLIVSEREGKYNLLDGAHRVAVLRKLDYSHTKCIVLKGLTYEQEAEYFRTQRQNTRPLTQFNLFKAGIEAGDPMCIKISEIAKGHGFEIRSSNKGFDTISAIHALKTVASVYGYEILDTTLRLIRETWDGVKQATNREFIVGVAEFVRRFGDAGFADNLRVKSISAIWQEYLTTTAHYSRATNDPVMRRSFCQAIMTQYNKGLHPKKRLCMED